MAVSFTEKERVGIISALRRAAGRHVAQNGMRKTTVDELASEAGISKGAFYKFYPSKEHLFLDMLEQWHREIATRVDAALAQNPGLEAPQRAALMLKTAWRAMREQSLIAFCQEDLPFVLRKVPERLLKEHYQTNEDFIRGLMNQAGVTLAVPETEAYAAIRILFFSLLVAQQVGDGYEAAMDGLIDGACSHMVSS